MKYRSFLNERDYWPRWRESMERQLFCYSGRSVFWCNCSSACISLLLAFLLYIYTIWFGLIEHLHVHKFYTVGLYRATANAAMYLTLYCATIFGFYGFFGFRIYFCSGVRQSWMCSCFWIRFILLRPYIHNKWKKTISLCGLVVRATG
jgi:hypothetical protein